MNSTTNFTEIRQIVENVNEHIIEEKTESLSFFFTFLGLTLCSFAIIWVRKNFQWLPHNALFMIIGFLISYITELITGIESKERLESMMSFNPNIYNFALFPLIMFESGFSIDAVALLDNSVSVIIFVMFECLVSTFVSGTLLYILPSLLGLPTLSLTNAMALAFVITPTEPSTVYSILKRYNISTHFTHFLMGEGMLTELLSLILIRSLVDLEIESDSIFDAIFNIVGTISTTLLGSILIGVFIGMLSSLIFKYLPSEQDEDKLFVEVSIFICCPFIAYMLAEACRLSGNISIRLCGIMMARYTQFNLSKSSRVFIHRFISFLGRICEVTVFFLLGLSTNLEKDMLNNADWIAFAFIIMMILRIVDIYVFTRYKQEYNNVVSSDNKVKDGILLWCSGLKGCVTYSLMFNLQTELLSHKEITILTHVSLGIIWISVVGLGCSYEFIIKLLGIPKSTHIISTPQEDNMILQSSLNVSDSLSSHAVVEQTDNVSINIPSSGLVNRSSFSSASLSNALLVDTKGSIASSSVDTPQSPYAKSLRMNEKSKLSTTNLYNTSFSSNQSNQEDETTPSTNTSINEHEHTPSDSETVPLLSKKNLNVSTVMSNTSIHSSSLPQHNYSPRSQSPYIDNQKQFLSVSNTADYLSNFESQYIQPFLLRSDYLHE